MTKRNFPFLYRRAEGVKVDLYILLKKILYITTMEYVYNNDHANYNYISSLGYILSGVFAVFHFKTSLHLLKEIQSVFLQKKTRNQLKRSRHDAIVDMQSDSHTFTCSVMRFLFFDKFLSCLK